MSYLYNTSLGLKLSAGQIVREIINFMRAEPQWHYKIVIGTDSEKAPDKTADFVIAIVVCRVGNGGRYFWRRIDENNKFHTLRDRIIQEVLFSIDTAKEILQLLKKEDIAPAWDFQIHIDVGEKGETKTMIQEVVGMVRANDFEAITKPDSYAASKVADRHV